MHVLNLGSYRAWRRLEEPAVKFWVRQWLDGVAVDTHPVWSYSPLGPSALNALRSTFQPVTGARDWGKHQRDAIAVLHKHHMAGIKSALVNVDTALTAAGRHADTAGGTMRALLLNALAATFSLPVALQHVRNLSAAAASELLFAGVSDSELFVRVGTGVLDAAGKHDAPPSERAIGTISKLASPESRAYLCATKIWSSSERPSKTLLSDRNLSRITGSNDVAIAYTTKDRHPVFVTRHVVSHSRTAFAEHRFVAGKTIAELKAAARMSQLRLDDETNVTIAALELPGVVEVRPRSAPWESLPRFRSDIEPHAIAAASAAIYDNPFEAVRMLSEAFERQLGARWESTVATRARVGLRAALLRDIVSTLKETRKRWKGQADAPVWLNLVTEDLNLAEIGRAITAAGADYDVFLVERIGRVLNSWSPSDGVVRANATIAKGLRNVTVHGSPVGDSLRPVAFFLARYMLALFGAIFPAPRRVRARPSEKPPA